MTGAFIGRRRDRLGARLLMLLNCIRLSDAFECRFYLDWFPPGADAPELATPEELFHPDWISDHLAHVARPEILEEDSVALWEFLSDERPDRLSDCLASGKNVIVDEGFEVVVFPWEDAPSVKERHRRLIDRVRFSDPVTSGIKAIERNIAGRPFTAYHVRRGDILDRAPWTHKTWPAKIEIDELYETHARKEPGGLGVVFSDTQDALKETIEEIPSLTRIGNLINVSGMTTAQKDFLELYAMSRAERILAPSISAFSSAAGRLASKDRNVFRDFLSGEEIMQCYERLAERLESGLESFRGVSEAAHLYGKLHSNLTARGKIERAWRIGKAIEAQGCDRAFLPILLGLNEYYLGRWDECERIARDGLRNPHLWPEDHAVLTALLAACVGALDRAEEATALFSRAFWAKPLRPDVVVLGSRLIYQGKIRTEQFPAVDWTSVRNVRQPWFPPFNNLSLVQARIIKRRPINPDLILLDWPDLALDRKALRLASDTPRLKALRASLLDANPEETNPIALASFRALVECRLGSPATECLKMSEASLRSGGDDLLMIKRHADLLEATGDLGSAKSIYRNLISEQHEDPYLHFAYGNLLIRNGDPRTGEDHILASARLDQSNAAIQGAAGQILLKRSETEVARGHLQRAVELCPAFNRFRNQLNRAKTSKVRAV